MESNNSEKEAFYSFLGKKISNSLEDIEQHLGTIWYSIREIPHLSKELGSGVEKLHWLASYLKKYLSRVYQDSRLSIANDIAEILRLFEEITSPEHESGNSESWEMLEIEIENLREARNELEKEVDFTWLMVKLYDEIVDKEIAKLNRKREYLKRGNKGRIEEVINPLTYDQRKARMKRIELELKIKKDEEREEDPGYQYYQYLKNKNNNNPYLDEYRQDAIDSQYELLEYLREQESTRTYPAPTLTYLERIKKQYLPKRN